MENAVGAMYEERFMQRAIELSRQAYKSGKGLPIGCVIVKDTTIVGEGHNEIFARTNPTAHGEIVAIENACSNLGTLDLTNCVIYTTLEPCPMCLSAIYWAKLKVVYYANSNQIATKIGFDDSFIFDEIKLHPEKRKIPIVHKASQEAIHVMETWKNSE